MPSSFTVKAKDRANGNIVAITVGANASIRNQADAEQHVATMPGSFGGRHPGFDVVAEPTPDAPAKGAESVKK